MLNIALRNTRNASTTLKGVDILRASVRGCTGGRRYATTLGIRREDPKRIWERRVPLTPEAVETLIKDGDDVEVEVESCERRCFPNDSYTKVGSSPRSKLTIPGWSENRPAPHKRRRYCSRHQRAASCRGGSFDQRRPRERPNMDGVLAYPQGPGESWISRQRGY